MTFNGKTIKFLGGFLGTVRHPIRSAQYGLHTLSNFFEKTSWRIQYENKYRNDNIDGIIDDNESTIDKNYNMSVNDAVNSLLSRSKYKLSPKDGKRLEGALNTMYKNCSEEELVKILLNAKNIDTKDDLESLIYNTLSKTSEIIKEEDKKLNIDDIDNFEHLDIHDVLALLLGNYKLDDNQTESLYNLINSIENSNKEEMKKVILNNGFVKNEEDFNNLIIILQKEFVDSSSNSILTEEEKRKIDKKFSSNKKQDEDEYSGIDFKKDDILDILSLYFSSEKLSDMQRNTIISKVQNLIDKHVEPILREEIEKLTKKSVISKYDELFNALNTIESNLNDIERLSKIGYQAEITKKYDEIMDNYSDRIHRIEPKEYYFSKFDELCKNMSMEDATKEIVEDLEEFKNRCANSYTRDQADEIERIREKIYVSCIELFDEKWYEDNDPCSKIESKYKNLALEERFIKTKKELEEYLYSINTVLEKEEKEKNKHQEELLEYENKIVEKYNELIGKYPDWNIDIGPESKFLESFEKFCESMDAKKAYDAIINGFNKFDNVCAIASEISDISAEMHNTLSPVISKDEKYVNDIKCKIQAIIPDDDSIELSSADEKKFEDIKSKMIDLKNEVDDYMEENEDKFNYIDRNFELADQIKEKVHYLKDKGLVSNYCDTVMKKIEEISSKYNNISNLNVESLIDDCGELRHIKYEIEEYIESLENPEIAESNEQKANKDFHVLTPSELVELYKKDDSQEEKTESVINSNVKENSEKTINIESLYDKRNEYARYVIELSNFFGALNKVNQELLEEIKLTSPTLEEGLRYCKDEDLIDRFNFTTIRLRELAEEKSLYESKLKQVENLINKKEQKIENEKQVELEKAKEEENKQREIEYEKAYLEAEKRKQEEIIAKKEEIREEIANIQKRKALKERRERLLAKKTEKAARLAKKEEAKQEVPDFETYISNIVKEAIMTYNEQFGGKHM